eukprot:g5914.t1
MANQYLKALLWLKLLRARSFGGHDTKISAQPVAYVEEKFKQFSVRLREKLLTNTADTVALAYVQLQLLLFRDSKTKPSPVFLLCRANSTTGRSASRDTSVGPRVRVVISATGNRSTSPPLAGYFVWHVDAAASPCSCSAVMSAESRPPHTANLFQ